MTNGGWMLAARRTSADYVSVGVPTPSSSNIINYNLRFNYITEAKEKFSNGIIKTYNLGRYYTMNKGWHDIQAVGETNNRWKLDVRMAPAGSRVDDLDLCSTYDLTTIKTKEGSSYGFAWQSYVNCSYERGFHGYTGYLGTDYMSISSFSDYSEHGVSAELWIR